MLLLALSKIVPGLSGAAILLAIGLYAPFMNLIGDLDLSTIIENGERLRDFIPDLNWVSHVHISEPGLAPIEKRPEHKELALLLGAVGYQGYVSVEMARTDLDTIRRTLDYVAEVFA